MFENRAVRGLELSPKTRASLGTDIKVWLNSGLPTAEVRDLMAAIAETERAIVKASTAKNRPGVDLSGELSQLKTDLRQQKSALASYFATVWEAADGSPMTAETVERLGAIIGQSEAKNLMGATLQAMDMYKTEAAE